MGDFAFWLDLALRKQAEPETAETPAEAKLRSTEMTFLASLNAARAKVIEDGLQVLLAAHERTIGDDPQFGLPLARRAA